MKKFIPAILIIIAVGAGIFGLSRIENIEATPWRASEIHTENTIKQLKSALSGDSTFAFHRDEKYGFFGSAILTGYILTYPSMCGVGDSLACDDTNYFDYSYFNVVRSENEEIFDFLKERKGKAFIIQRSIGLGCYQEEEGRLFSKNSGDRGSYDNLVTGESLQQLMASGPKNYVRLKVTRPIYTDKKIAPYCYSLFREFKVLPYTAEPTKPNASSTVPTASSTEQTLR